MNIKSYLLTIIAGIFLMPCFVNAENISVNLSDSASDGWVSYDNGYCYRYPWLCGDSYHGGYGGGYGGYGYGGYGRYGYGHFGHGGRYSHGGEHHGMAGHGGEHHGEGAGQVGHGHR